MLDVSSLPQKAPDFDLRELLEAGCHFGHQARKWHPKMAKWIFTEKDGVHIFDLAKTSTQLQIAYNLVFDYAQKGKTIIVIGTKKHAREALVEYAAPAGMMTIMSRWLGGLLTNWEQVNRSLKRMLDIERGLKEGKFDHYTKLERVLLDKERQRLERFFGGIRELKGKPDLLFVIDPGREKVAVAEARKTGVPIVALIDSNTNPDGVDLPIPANDDAARSIALVVQKISEAYTAGKAAKN